MSAKPAWSAAARAAATAYSVALLSLFTSATTSGATCSCAEPLLGVMQSSTYNSRYYIGTGFEFHDLSDLVAGSRDVPDQTGRDRTSQAFVVEGSAALSEHWSVAGITTWLEYERRVGTGSANQGRGIGDGVATLRWTALRSSLTQPWSFSPAVGARIPMGDNNRKTNRLTLAEDLQPSTGAWGTVLQLGSSRALTRSGTWVAWGSLAAAWNGENDRNYQFGLVRWRNLARPAALRTGAGVAPELGRPRHAGTYRNSQHQGPVARCAGLSSVSVQRTSWRARLSPEATEKGSERRPAVHHGARCIAWPGLCILKRC